MDFLHINTKIYIYVFYSIIKSRILEAVLLFLILNNNFFSTHLITKKHSFSCFNTTFGVISSILLFLKSFWEFSVVVNVLNIVIIFKNIQHLIQCFQQFFSLYNIFHSEHMSSSIKFIFHRRLIVYHYHINTFNKNLFKKTYPTYELYSWFLFVDFYYFSRIKCSYEKLLSFCSILNNFTFFISSPLVILYKNIIIIFLKFYS